MILVMRKERMMINDIKLRIGEVEKLTRLHRLTIKSLEKRGLIKAERSLAGHRLFDIGVIDEIRKIYGQKK